MRFLSISCVLLLAAVVHAADDPVEIEAEDDTYLTSDHTGRPAGRGEQPDIQIYGRGDHTLFRGLFKFNLKNAAPGFKSAVMRLTCWNGHWTQTGSSFVRCHPVLSAWDQGDASWDERQGKSTWKNPGGDWDPKPLCASVFTGPIGGEKSRVFDFDVTNAARAWQGQPGQNYGVVIMLEKGCSAELRFRSKEFTDASQRPKLLLYYQKPAQLDSFTLKADQVAPFEPYNPDAPSVQLSGKPSGAINIGDSIEAKFNASGAKGPYAFAQASQAIPGLSLSPDGTLKGKPSKAGTYIFGVNCTASNGKRSSDWQRWVVVDPNAKAPEVVAAKKDDAPAGAGGKKAEPPPLAKKDKPNGPAEE